MAGVGAHSMMILLLAAVAAPASAVTLNMAGAGSPIRKVLSLLEEMRNKLDEEAGTDQEIYDKQACWCNTNIKEKTASVEAGTKRIAALTNGIEKLAADSARYDTEVAQLGQEIQKAEDSIDEATALRNAQRADFKKTEKEVLDLIDQVVAAETSLGKAPADGAVELQLPHAKASDMIASLQREVSRHTGLFMTGDHSNIDAFLSSSSRSGEVFLQRRADQESPDVESATGVLDGMKTDFIANLGSARTEETDRLLAFNKMMPAKKAEKKAMEEQKENKENAKADADQKRANNKQVIADTKIQIEEDTKFLADVKEKLRLLDKEWDERQKTRGEETEVLSKTMEVLSANDKIADSPMLMQDNSQEVEADAVAPRQSFWGSLSATSFLQESSISGVRAQASAMLFKVGKRLDARLVTLAMRTKLDTFERVKESIEAMMQALDKEQKDEVKHKDYCVDELNQNQLDAEDKNRTHQLQGAELVQIEAAIKTASNEAAALQADIEELQKQMKLAEENREQENKEFQAVIPEQRETQQALAQALAVLKGFYPSEATGLAQISSESSQQPEGFKAYKKNAGGLGIMSMIQQLIDDSKVMEAEAMEAEQTSQTSYQEFIAGMTASIKSKKKAIVDVDEGRAKKEIHRTQTAEAKQFSFSEIAQLAVTRDQLHQSCDFVLGQFEVRQKARQEEIDSLGQAKAILSGADFGSEE